MATVRDTGRNLLFGLLALQNSFIDRDALVAAFGTWVSDKSKPLSSILLARGALDSARHTLLEALVAEHLKLHGDDPERSLAALAVGGSTRESLERIGDAGLDDSLSHAGLATVTGGQDSASPYALETSSAQGRRFRVLRPHAQGGLGAVFVALDSELNREVALKEILDRHADNIANRARFVMEAEITGRLEHPGIVPVYGLGTYADGRPFYAMRFIRGDSLKEAIAAFHGDMALNSDRGQRSLELRKLLRRFLDVCNAIDYAHSRGVLHRDIKPGNVIVGKYGETLVVDWGLAKPIGRREPGMPSDERTLWPSSSSGSAETLPGSAVGTPAYMSPEQAAGELDRLGPRSDVYSLGATLYSALTGRPPFGGTEVNEILRLVAKGSFPPPRRIDPTIDRALESICLKAMAKKPADRYATPRALADDVERWIADEPVLAWREPLLRRARRWARRHRTAVTSVATAVLAVLLGLGAVVGVQSQANRALKAANDAIAKGKEATELALARSEESRQRAEAVLSFLQGGILAAARPEGKEGGLGRSVTLRKAIDTAEPKIAEAFKDQPEVEAAVRLTLGETYYYMKEARLAIRQLERALDLRQAKFGPDHPDTLICRCDLASAYVLDGRSALAITLLEETLKVREAKLGPDHPDTLLSRNCLAEAYGSAGRTADAITQHEANVKLCRSRFGPDHPSTLHYRTNLAAACMFVGRLAEAITLLEETLKLREAKLGPDDPDTLITRHSLALAYKLAGRTSDAIPLYESILKVWQSRLGPDHTDTLTCQGNLAAAYGHVGRTAEALALDEAALKLRETKFGPDHPDTLASRNSVAAAYAVAGRTADAIALDEGTLKLREAKLGLVHPDTFITRLNLANGYQAAGRPADAIALIEGTLGLPNSQLSPDSPIMIATRSTLTTAYAAAGRMADAIKMHEGTVKLRESKPGPDHTDALTNLQYLVVSYEAIERWADAEPLRRDGLARRRKSVKPGSPELANELGGLGLNLLNQSKWAEAEPVLRECLAIREKTRPDTWSRYNAMSQLGGVLLGQGKFAEAEPLIVQGYEGTKARAREIRPIARTRLPEAAARVIRLYERWGKPEKAAAWKAKVGLGNLPAQVFAPR